MIELLKPNITDIIDITAVTVILYLFLRFLKGTRAFQILSGLLIIIIFAIIARVLNLRALSLMLNSIGAIWIIAVIILFQPELRSLLARMGRYKTFKMFLKSNRAVSISEVAKAAEECKKKKIGALMVLERDIGLDEYIATGVKLNAKVSAPLIVSIFTPLSPLHDGAIIIREDTIVSAGCVLPTSDEPPIKKYYGLRHRAAIGISAVSDAAAVVISGTTGKLSLALDTKLYGNLTSVELKNYLEKIYLTKEE